MSSWLTLAQLGAGRTLSWPPPMHRHVAGISSWQRRCLAAAGKTNAHHMTTKHHTRTAVLKLQHPRGEVPPQRESMTNAGTAHPLNETGTMLDAHYHPLSLLPSPRHDPTFRPRFPHRLNRLPSLSSLALGRPVRVLRALWGTKQRHKSEGAIATRQGQRRSRLPSRDARQGKGPRAQPPPSSIHPGGFVHNIQVLWRASAACS